MIEVLTSLLGVTLAIAVFTVLGECDFEGLSIWVYVPIKESPFADGVVNGIQKMFGQLSGAVSPVGHPTDWLCQICFILFGPWSGGGVHIYFIGMKRVFNCGIFDTSS